jgi:outer membrane lipoprotein-sorting protein
MTDMGRLLTLAGVLAAIAGTRIAASTGQERALPAVLTDTIARYAALATYADTGTMTEEIAGMVHETTLRTSFRRATRDFAFDFHPQRTRYPKLNGHVADISGNRLVIWMFKGRMQTYSFYFKRHTAVPDDQQPGALKEAVAPTSGVAALIPSLLYPKAQLPGTLVQIEQASAAGTESIAGHPCQVVTADAAEYYPSGRRTNLRHVTLWIDADSKLLRRIREDKVTGGGSHRITVSLEPHANPTIDDAAFAFAVPAGK